VLCGALVVYLDLHPARSRVPEHFRCTRRLHCKMQAADLQRKLKPRSKRARRILEKREPKLVRRPRPGHCMCLRGACLACFAHGGCL
jgi:hypothetical protein